MGLSKEAILKINMTHSIRDNGIVDTLKCMLKVIEDRYPCPILGFNPPDWVDCDCAICSEFGEVTGRIEEAMNIAKAEEFDSMQRDGV